MQRNANVIKLLSDLVAIDSQSVKDNSSIISLLAGWFKDYKQSTQVWVRDIDGVKGKNLIVKIPGVSSEKCLVFICHTDTVPPSESWETNPFILEENNGKLYGLGACDTKGGIASLIEAVFTLPDKPAYDVYLVFDGDEEATSVGVQKFIKQCKLKNPKFIAIEPTDNKILIGQRSIIKFIITTHGVPQHSSIATPEINKKYNAIYKMTEVMKALSDDAEKLSYEKDALLGTHTQNFGVISGGTVHNVIPEACTLTMHRRILPNRDMYKELQEVKRIVHSVDKTADVVLMGPPEAGFKTSVDSLFTKSILTAAQSFIPETSFDVFRAWSEAGATSEKGESIIYGPGSLSEAHRANEFVEAKELFQFVHIYQKIMQEVQF